jgi:hypothetical protein
MNQELVDYIKQQMSLNVSKNKITDVLLGQGWQQPELDEAFTAAEGVANAAAKSFYDDPDPGIKEDIAGDAPRGGTNKKMMLIGVVTLVVVLAIGGILILSSQGGEEKPSIKDPVIEVSEEPAAGEAGVTVDNNEPANDSGFGKQTPVVDNTAVISSVARLEDAITFPAGWELREGVKNNRPTVGYFKPEAEKDASGKEIFTEYISITQDSIKASGATDAVDYLTKSKADLTANITDFKISNEKSVVLGDGTSATLIGGSYTDEGIAKRSMQLFVFKGDEAYVITGFVLASNWEAEKDMLGAAVLSFKVPAGN